MEEWGLVDLVEEPHRHQEQSGAEVERPPQHEIERRELDRSRAVLGGRGLLGGRVLELDLGIEQETVTELVARIEHEALEIEAIFLAALVVHEVLVVELAITS